MKAQSEDIRTDSISIWIVRVSAIVVYFFACIVGVFVIFIVAAIDIIKHCVVLYPSDPPVIFQISIIIWVDSSTGVYFDYTGSHDRLFGYEILIFCINWSAHLWYIIEIIVCSDFLALEVLPSFCEIWWSSWLTVRVIVIILISFFVIVIVPLVLLRPFNLLLSELARNLHSVNSDAVVVVFVFLTFDRREVWISIARSLGSSSLLGCPISVATTLRGCSSTHRVHMKLITRFLRWHGSEATSFAVSLPNKLSQAGAWSAINLIELDFFVHVFDLPHFIHRAANNIGFVTRRACRLAYPVVVTLRHRI